MACHKIICIAVIIHVCVYISYSVNLIKMSIIRITERTYIPIITMFIIELHIINEGGGGRPIFMNY